jgi:[ribosomal protein S5]-alanine N-acetyltransferase
MHVLLRALQADDEADFLAAVAASRKLHHPWVSPPSTPQAFASSLARLQGGVNHGYLVRAGGSGGLAGCIGVTNIVRGTFCSAYLGYYAFAGFERQGLMKQALSQLVRKAFRELRLHRLEANIQPGNHASIALARSCGFVQEGYSARYLKVGGRWRDHERWAVLAH